MSTIEWNYIINNNLGAKKKSSEGPSYYTENEITVNF